MRLLYSIPLLFCAGLASAQTSQMIAQNGLAATETRLATQADPSANDRFALGAVRFLRGIENTLQFRWQHNMAIKDFDMPGLSLPVPPNPDAAPFTPDLILTLFEHLRDDMALTQDTLGQVDAQDVALEIDLTDIWFDINMNQQRDFGEGLIEVGLNTVASPRQAAEMAAQGMDNTLVRFDSADVAWLNAYSHLLGGISELVIAFDPTEAIAKVLETDQQLINLRGNRPSESFYDAQFGGWVDRFAMVYGALNQQPLADHTRAARFHFLIMLSENKTFWARVALETDNENEWIPNAHQTAALGFTLPEGAAESWQAVLDDAEKLLNGKLLVSYWRLEPMGGINVMKLFENPPVVDIVDWVQGSGLLPYMELGPTVSTRNLRQFDRMMSGDALLYSILFN